MRIGIDYRTALINREGIGRATRELVRGLVELGHGADLGLFGWTLAPMKMAREELGLDGSEARLSRFRFPSRWIPDLLRTLNKGVDDLAGGCDVFHHTQPHLLPVRAAVEVATIYDCIYMMPGGYVSDEAAAAMTASAREMVRRAKLILVPSRFVADDVAARLGAQPSSIVVTSLGCDHVLRHLPPDAVEPLGEPYVLTVSRVDARKNHVRMLHAFERLCAEGFPHRWIVAGPDGHAALEFERALSASSAKRRVQRLRVVDDTEIAKLYANADLFLFASSSEGFGLPPLEAMACGTPVVAGDNSSMPEVLGDAALLVDASDADAIFEAARRVLAEPELSAELVRRGRARAAILTWKSCARSTFDVYRAAVGAT
jgi:glycosyltransferase involved in cell wall biosynthesis